MKRHELTSPAAKSRAGAWLIVKQAFLARPWIAAVALTICVGMTVDLIWLLPDPLPDQVSESEYRFYAAKLQEIRRQIASDEHPTVFLDVADFAHGQWTTLCLFGGYTHPIREMRTRGATVHSIDERRFPRTFLDIDDVNEFEAVIAFTDARNTAHFVQFPRGFGVMGQHFKSCVARPQTVIYFGKEA